MTPSKNHSPIGIFDSGVGGLSILKAITKELPGERMIYIADQQHVPYGLRPLSEVRSFAVAITRFLLAKGAKIIVVACNAASAAALQHLRSIFPGTRFIGMEPAVKPAAENSTNKTIAILATPATFQGELYASVVDRFAKGVTLLPHTCPGLVVQIEKGDLDGPITRQILEDALRPLLTRGADTVVLGCTHFPFVIPLIQEICGSGVQVVDPAPAIARQTWRVLRDMNLTSPEKENGLLFSTIYSTNDPELLKSALDRLIGLRAKVHRLNWSDDGRLVEPQDHPQ